MDLYSLTHLLLSFSLFSFIISYSTSYSCLIYSFKFYLSTLISHILDKNCIFLVFNGIVVFLAKTSGFKNLSNVNVGEEYQDLNLALEEKKIDNELEDEPRGEESDVCNVQDVEDHELDLVTNDNQEEEEEEEEENINDLLNSEDLNKKFEDFIRRVKEEFRSGAQQQLVMA